MRRIALLLPNFIEGSDRFHEEHLTEGHRSTAGGGDPVNFYRCCILNEGYSAFKGGGTISPESIKVKERPVTASDHLRTGGFPGRLTAAMISSIVAPSSQPWRSRCRYPPDRSGEIGALESLALEAYRSHALTAAQLRRLLGFETRMQVDAFLKELSPTSPIVVVADTTPINYLILIRKIDLLNRLYKRVLVPPAVLAELKHSIAPKPVYDWAVNVPSWVEVQPGCGSARFRRERRDRNEALLDASYGCIFRSLIMLTRTSP